MNPELAIVIGGAVGFVALALLALRSGWSYSVEDTKADSVDYAETIEEGHGGMTAFLWVTFALLLALAVYYLLVHLDEFAVIFSS